MDFIDRNTYLNTGSRTNLIV